MQDTAHESRSASATLDPRPDLLEAIRAADAGACARWLEVSSMADAVHDLSALDEDERAAFVRLLPADSAAELVSHLPEHHTIELFGQLEAPAAAGILAELPSDERADVIRELDDDDAHAILTELEEHVARDTRRLAEYDEGEVGSLMLSEYLSFPASATVKEVLADLEENADRYYSYNIQYTYVTDADGMLMGVLPLRNLLLARRSTPVSEVMVAKPISVGDKDSLESLRHTFKEYHFLGLPVISEGRLVGVVEKGDLARAEAEEADDLYRQSQGIIGGEELRSMPLLLRSRRRLAWLSINILLNIAAASMIAIHQDTLQAVIALAVFLPIISDMSGCSGNQAVAVTMRELTLGVTRPGDFIRVFFKEISLGMINGLALGVLIGSVAFIWKGNVYLGVVVGSALMINTIVAVCMGGLIPLALKRFKADPALASGPILTTITDMCGFFIVLTIASMMLDSLI
ncbi:MAG: magnesium transporter [Phycisphaerales bacterium]